MASYTLGLDYGTNSVRAIVVRVTDGFEAGTAVWNYAHGDKGVVLSEAPNLARQHPADYLEGAMCTVQAALAEATANDTAFRPEQIIGIGVDTTGSTPLPIDADGTPLAFHKDFENNLDALAWLWKDHTSIAEAEEITALAAQEHPEYLAKCGGVYSSEWFFSKILHCLRAAPEVFDAAYTWIECADWIPAVLTGNTRPGAYKVSVCAAGHKAMFNADWGGYPARDFLAKLDPKLGTLRDRLHDKAYAVDSAAGALTTEWAGKLGLPEGIPVAVGAFDAHLGAVGSGIGEGCLSKVLGTSGCDMMVAPGDRDLPDIPGLCGIVKGSILPGMYGLEAGQSAVGDIYNWFVDYIQPGGPEAGSHEALTEAASAVAPGASGLLALDWNNGNRTILIDQRLTGLILGQTLYTTPGEIYRALIESTAFGALTIINRFEEYGVTVERIVNCGGIAEKNPLVMQIYADVTGREMAVSRSGQTCALGAAIAGAVVAGESTGGYADFSSAQQAMTGLKDHVYKPNPEAHAIYRELYTLYRSLHDAFGLPEWQGNLYSIMKRLLDIRQAARKEVAR